MGSLDADSILEAIRKYPLHSVDWYAGFCDVDWYAGFCDVDWYAGFCDQPENLVRNYVSDLIKQGRVSYVFTEDSPADALKLLDD